LHFLLEAVREHFQLLKGKIPKPSGGRQLNLEARKCHCNIDFPLTADKPLRVYLGGYMLLTAKDLRPVNVGPLNFVVKTLMKFSFYRSGTLQGASLGYAVFTFPHLHGTGKINAPIADLHS
jgi:hypothetical protein